MMLLMLTWRFLFVDFYVFYVQLPAKISKNILAIWNIALILHTYITAVCVIASVVVVDATDADAAADVVDSDATDVDA